MISILAPSKTLDESPAPAWVVSTTAQFANEATEIIENLSTLTQNELTTMMGVSESLAQATHSRVTKWGKVQKPALWLYRGDVYKGMYADELTESDARWAQHHLRIMSGLYGVLCPLDAISPYRLEMKTKLTIGGASTLYEFWGDTLARALDEVSEGVICNLSSDEYARPITKYTSSRVVTPVFMDHKPNGRVGQVPIYSKMMRGVMARWIITERVDDPQELVRFSGHGYVYDAAQSSEKHPTFVRPAPMTPLVF